MKVIVARRALDAKGASGSYICSLDTATPREMANAPGSLYLWMAFLQFGGLFQNIFSVKYNIVTDGSILVDHVVCVVLPVPVVVLPA